MKTVYQIRENGTIVTDSKAKTAMWRKTTCNGCGYSQTTVMSYEQDKNLWNTTHSLARCRSRKAFDEMMGNPLEALANLSIR